MAGDDLADLLVAIARHDRPAFRRLHEVVAPKLFAVLLRILNDRSLAQDVLQDVFLRVWQNAASYSPALGSPMVWLTSITRYRAIDVLRQAAPGRLRPPSVDEADPYEGIAATGDLETEISTASALRHCLGQLEPTARACVLLAYYEGFSREELAERYERPVNTIKTWLHRSLISLKACLDAPA